MISLKIYRYLLILLILICVVCIFLLFRSQIFKDKKELQIGAMWFLIILIINFGNMFYTLMYYDKNKDKIVTIKGASGVSPNRSEIIAYNAWDWAQAIWHDMLS